MKKNLLNFPEVLILLLSIYWFAENYFSSKYFNIVAFAIFLIALYQLIFKNKIIGVFLATIIASISLYMILAVISEYNEFPYKNSKAITLLSVGLSFCLVGILSSMLMFLKYFRNQFI